MGSITLLRGMVKGNGREADCEVLARKRNGGDGGESAAADGSPFTDCQILGAPSELPDGEYMAFFEGYCVRVSKLRGLWMTRGPAAKHEEPPRAAD